MDQHTPEEKDSCASKLSLSLEKEKGKKNSITPSEGFVILQ